MKREFNKYLKTLSQKELQILYSKFESVKKYYQLELSGDSTVVVKEYKERVFSE